MRVMLHSAVEGLTCFRDAGKSPGVIRVPGDDTRACPCHGSPMSSRPHATRYRIVVKGRLSERYEPAFDGLRLEAGDGITALSGTFVDHAQLYGVLDRLRDLGIELVSVNASS
jgi:hypothetical protein